MPEWNFNGFAHGADYNPDQWRHIPGTLEQDLRLMKLAKCNIMSVGIFSWAALEPEEGAYNFGWLKDVIDRLYENGVSVLLATPSGARPVWMSEKYPEVLRVMKDGRRIEHGGRHNHCYTSPAYRGFVTNMNTALAEAFGRHPGVVGWHISNEYFGECYCTLCEMEFQRWLEARYGDIDALNRAWWTGFWSKTFSSFAQVKPPFSHGESSVHGLNLDWKRFVTSRTVDFMAHECEPLRRITPNLPVTTNMMEMFVGLDYSKFTSAIDFASHDLYPAWGSPEGDFKVAMRSSMMHDWMRSLLNKPFVLMESTPSMVNWQPVNRPKRPGMHLLSSMQAVAHGADSIQYFQWRKSRGATEKFHGAVVDHVGHEHTRVFRDVSEVGEWLEKLAPVAHSATKSDVALIFDTENRWAIEDAAGPRRDVEHLKIVTEHYEALVRQGLNVDIIDSERPLDSYKLVVAPQLYMVKPGVAGRLEEFVRAGGTLVLTYWSGIVDETDLCFLGGFPGPLRQLVGVWSEEIDSVYECERNGMRYLSGNRLGLNGTIECGFLLDQIHAEGAEVLAMYEGDFYAGQPALTRNEFGAGRAYYIAARTDADALTELYSALVDEAGIGRLIYNMPKGITAAKRGEYLFVMNFSGGDMEVALPDEVDVITGASVSGVTTLRQNQVIVIRVSE